MSFIDVSTNKKILILSFCKKYSIASAISSALEKSGLTVLSYDNADYKNNMHEQLENHLHDCNVILLIDKDYKLFPWLKKELVIAQNQDATIMPILIDNRDLDTLSTELKTLNVLHINSVSTEDNLLSIVRAVKELV